MRPRGFVEVWEGLWTGLVDSTDMDQIIHISHQCTPNQRRALYRFLLTDPENVKSIVRSMTVEQADVILKTLVQITQDMKLEIKQVDEINGNRTGGVADVQKVQPVPTDRPIRLEQDEKQTT